MILVLIQQRLTKLISHCKKLPFRKVHKNFFIYLLGFLSNLIDYSLIFKDIPFSGKTSQASILLFLFVFKYILILSIIQPYFILSFFT